MNLSEHIAGAVRPATDADMQSIEAWLPRDRSIGTLAANWNLTQREFQKGQVFVWAEAETGSPVAYCWGTLNSHDSILEVQPAFRGRGIGQALVDFMIEASVRANEPLLEIQCAPESSESFWKRVGFETDWRYGRCYGRRMLDLRRDVPDGVRVPVEVVFLPEHAAWKGDATPFAVRRLEGVDSGFGKIELDALVAYFDPPQGGDLVVDVKVSGESWYRGKAKYGDAYAIGVRRCLNGFAVGEVHRPVG